MAIVKRLVKGSELTAAEHDTNCDEFIARANHTGTQAISTVTGLQTALDSKLADITGESVGDLSDVTITTPSTGQVIKWNGTAWVNDTDNAGGISDGDKGDVTVSSSGTVWTIDNGVVTLAKMANMATDSFIARQTAGSGAPEVISAADARTILNVEDGANNFSWSGAVDGDIIPDADGTRDLGSTTNRFANLHVDSIDLNGNTVTSTATKTAPTGEVVGTTDTQTLTNKNIQLTVNAQTGTTYTLVLADAHKKVTMSNASANTLTIPTNASVALPVGTVVGVSMIGAGTTTVDGDTGVTVNGVSGGGATISAQYSGVTLTKIATDEWLMEGNHGTVA